MPLFFFLSGLFFHAKNTFIELVKHRAYQLLVPYYLFSCLMLGKPIGHALFPQIYILFIISGLLFAAVSFVYYLANWNEWIIQQLVGIIPAIIGIAMTLCLARLIPSFSWLCTIGTSTLVYYSFNDIMLKIWKLFAFKIFPAPMSLQWYMQLMLP